MSPLSPVAGARSMDEPVVRSVVDDSGGSRGVAHLTGRSEPLDAYRVLGDPGIDEEVAGGFREPTRAADVGRGAFPYMCQQIVRGQPSGRDDRHLQESGAYRRWSCQGRGSRRRRSDPRATAPTTRGVQDVGRDERGPVAASPSAERHRSARRRAVRGCSRPTRTSHRSDRGPPPCRRRLSRRAGKSKPHHRPTARSSTRSHCRCPVASRPNRTAARNNHRVR